MIRTWEDGLLIATADISEHHMNLYNRLNKLCVGISDENKFLQWAEDSTVRHS